MKKILFALLVCPLFSAAQEPEPRFEDDTLYTSSGYKIFSGQTLEFGKGLERDNRFRYVTIKNGFLSKTLCNSAVIVKSIKDVSTSALGNGYIDLTGYIILKDGKREFIVLHMAFDKAIENSPDLPTELKVPDEYRNKFKRNIEKELITTENLYQDRVISKAEYNVLIEKLLKQR
jgi:hypothetical protein